MPPRPMARFMLGTGLRARREPSSDTEALRRTVRLVWTEATLVGGVGRARRAAAAAAEERLYAETAAVAALGSTEDAVGGWERDRIVSSSPWAGEKTRCLDKRCRKKQRSCRRRAAGEPQESCKLHDAMRDKNQERNKAKQMGIGQEIGQGLGKGRIRQERQQSRDE